MTKRKTYNTGIIIVLKNKYGFSVDYIRKCLRGDRVGFMPDEIKQDYKNLLKAAEKLEVEKLKQLQEKANNLK